MLPLEQVCRLTDLDERGRILLAAITNELLTRYDNLFRVPFLTLWGGMGAVVEGDQAHWQLHANFYPPLLRSASVKKFMGGYEMLGD
jgi:UDPglucose--hexose-1-phosphate uridylyltransferase